MSSQAPWSIKGVDKDTREKMKQMAHEQGMSLADFLETLMHASSVLSKDTITQVDSNTVDSNTVDSNTVDNNSDQMNADSLPQLPFPRDDHVLSIDGLPENPIPLQNNNNKTLNQTDETIHHTIATTQHPHIEEKEQDYLKNSRLKSEKNRPAPAKNAKNKSEILTSMHGKTNLFSQLTQKAGIASPALLELSQNDISETVMRERQLRDMMRIQMTEMRQMFQTMLHDTVDQKFSELKASFNQYNALGFQEHSSHSDNPSTHEHVISLPENIVTKEDLVVLFEQFTQHIDTKIQDQRDVLQNTQSDGQNFVAAENTLTKEDFLGLSEQFLDQVNTKIENKFLKYQETIQSFYQENSSVLHNDIQEFGDKLLEHNESRVAQLVQNAILDHKINQTELSGGDIAMFSALRDSTDILTTRMARIEESCSMLDNKLTVLQSDLSFTLQSEHKEDAISLDEIKNEIQTYMQSIPDYIEKVMNNNQKDMSPLLSTLHLISDRIVKIEGVVKQLFSRTDEQTQYNSFVHKNEFPSKENSYQNAPYISTQAPVMATDRIDENDDDSGWIEEEDSSKQEDNRLYNLDALDTPRHNPHDFLSDSEDEIHDIRQIDKNALLSGTRKNFEKKLTEKKNNDEATKTFIAKFGGAKNVVLFGTMIVTVLVLLLLIFQN